MSEQMRRFCHFLRKQNVRCGMMASSVDCAGIARMIRKEYDDIIWVSASLKGSQIHIDVKENSDSREISEENPVEEGNDLIAEKGWVIIQEIVTRSGVPMVHAGDGSEGGGPACVRTRGDQKRQPGGCRLSVCECGCRHQDKNKENYEDVLDLSYTVKKYEKQKKRQIFLRTAQKEYTLGQKVEEGKGREVSSSEIRPGFSLSFPFPFSFGIREEVSYREVKKTYSKKEYQEILSLEFDRFCEDLRKKGFKFLRIMLKYTRTRKVQEQKEQ